MRGILASNPDVLKYYGVDPDQLKEELRKSDEAIAEIELNFETVKKNEFETLWREWVGKYIVALAGSEDTNR